MAVSVPSFQSTRPLQLPPTSSSSPHSIHLLTTTLKLYPKSRIPKMVPVKAFAVPDLGFQGAVSGALDLIQASPPTWESAILSNLLIFTVGSPILVSGLSLSGIGAAFLLGTLTWRAFGASGFLLVATYFIIGTAATKLKMAQKEAQGVAEKRRGRRGPGSVIGSSAAGCVCAFLSIYGVGGASFSGLWQLGFVASFCTKLSDTVSSEIGKAYGKTTTQAWVVKTNDLMTLLFGVGLSLIQTSEVGHNLFLACLCSAAVFETAIGLLSLSSYLVTTFKVVPRGTEGAVSVEGTIAGLLASILLASAGCVMGEINAPEAVICVAASQIANLGESVIGATFQEKEGFRWLNNDAVNIINISLGSILAVFLQQLMLQSWQQ